MTAEIIEGIGRIYTTPEGAKYPSVTTVLSKASDQSWIAEWHARVGKEHAARVLAQAGRRGTAIHELAEEYLKNNVAYKKGHMPSNIFMFSQIKSILDKNITKIYGLEVPLYSDKLKVAGRVDVLADWNENLSIIDFKTSKRMKLREDIPNYFIQASAYAWMTWERTGLLPGQIVIVIMFDDDNPLVYVERTRDWIQKFIDMRKSVDI